MEALLAACVHLTQDYAMRHEKEMPYPQVWLSISLENLSHLQKNKGYNFGGGFERWFCLSWICIKCGDKEEGSIRRMKTFCNHFFLQKLSLKCGLLWKQDAVSVFSYCLFHAFHVAKSLNSAAVWSVMTESEKMLSVCLYNSPLVRLKLSDEKWKVGVSISQMYCYIFPCTMTMESTVSCVCLS